MQIVRYEPGLKQLWDEAVDASRNGTFLFRRDYMDYHADRFTDCSLLALDSDGSPLALLPASLHGEEARSHGGLTYGGLVMSPRLTGGGPASPLGLLPLMGEQLRLLGAKKLIYKPVPHIYHRYPAEEDLYALWRMGAVLRERNLAVAIDQRAPLPSSTLGTKARRHKRLGNIIVEESTDARPVMEIVAGNLAQRYGASPVHTADEMDRLRRLFPGNIRFFTASAQGETLAAMVVYVTDMLAHQQYIGSTPRGKEMHAEDVMMATVVREVFATSRYYDYGTCNENHGRVLNEGLLAHKECYGARGIAYDVYELPL